METLKHHFLIAMPQIDDSFFEKSIVYIFEHNEQGAMGVMINRPIGITLNKIFEQLDLQTEQDSAKNPVLLGGPVDGERGFILHMPSGNWQSSVAVTDEISMTTSRDLLSAAAQGQGPKSMILMLGYARWDARQLEEEIAKNNWLHVPASTQILFAYPPEVRYQETVKLLGFDLNLMPLELGHA